MRLALAIGLLAATGAATAADIDQLGSLSQRQFRNLTEDLGAALSYKALAPAEPLGVTGFDLGVEVTVTSLANTEAFEAATGSSDVDVLAVPKIHLHKGLPFNLDLGLSYSAIPTTNVSVTGAELRYAFIEGGVAMPAVAVRGTWSKMDGVDQMDLTTKGLELTVSKGFTVFTPYAGVGQVWVDSSTNVTGLKDESVDQTKYYAGLNLNTGLMNFALEADRTGDANTWGAKAGFRW